MAASDALLTESALGWSIFAIVLLVILAFCWVYIRKYQSRRESEVVSTITAICALAVALITSALLPVDIFLVSFMKFPNGTYKDWAANNDTRGQIEDTVLYGYYNGQVTDHVTVGPSTGNQRIERWWLTLRSQCAQFWMDIFDQLRCDGHFADTFLDKSLVRFCFLSTIQEELDEVASTWNEHRIRRVHDSRSPHGRPAIIHAVPELYGATDYKYRPGLDKIEACLTECVFKDFPCDEDVFHICVDLMSEHNLSLTNDVFETVNLYITLRQLINNDLDVND